MGPECSAGKTSGTRGFLLGFQVLFNLFKFFGQVWHLNKKTGAFNLASTYPIFLHISSFNNGFARFRLPLEETGSMVVFLCFIPAYKSYQC